jgi:hypothetical protein
VPAMSEETEAEAAFAALVVNEVRKAIALI